MRFLDKYSLELDFQKKWVREFENNISKVLEYWRKYRCLDKINKICDINSNKVILDVGCGISTVLHYIKGERHGIDPLADQYKELYCYPDAIDIRKGLGEEIPFPDKYFDIVFCSNVLDHVTDPEKTIKEIHRVLRRNGNFILTVIIFKEKKDRKMAHPHSLRKQDVYLLMENKFKPIFEKEQPWIGLRRYINGLNESLNKELVMILKK